MAIEFFYDWPEALLAGGATALFLLASEVGFRLGRWSRSRADDATQPQAGTGGDLRSGIPVIVAS